MVTISDLGLISGVSQTVKVPRYNLYFIKLYSGDPLYVGFDLTIASFDSISEVSMVSIPLNMQIQMTYIYSSPYIWNIK